MSRGEGVAALPHAYSPRGSLLLPSVTRSVRSVAMSLRRVYSPRPGWHGRNDTAMRDGLRGRGGPMDRLEQLDQIAVRVGEQDLPPTRAGDQVAAEGQVCIAEPGDLGVEVVDDEVDAVTAGDGGIVGGGAGTGTGGAGQQQPQRPTDHVGESGCGTGVQREAEVGGVEVDGGLDVADEVADAGVLVGHGHG